MPKNQKANIDESDEGIGTKLDAIGTRLDVIINLLLDMLPDEAFMNPHQVSHKAHRLKLTRVKMRPTDIGRAVGSPAKDVSRRLSEYKSEEVVKRIKRRGPQQCQVENPKPNLIKR